VTDKPDNVDVERLLRGRADFFTSCGEAKSASLMREAANAVEALRAENARLREFATVILADRLNELEEDEACRISMTRS
jgi:hypothetical protein